MYQSLLEIPIDEIDVPKPHLSLLKEMKITSVGQVFQYERKQLLEIMENLTRTEVDKIREKAREVGEKYGFGWEQQSQKEGGLVTFGEARTLLGFNNSSEFQSYIELGVFDPFEFTLKVGEDVVPPKTSTNDLVFSKSKINEFKDEYKTLTEIAEMFHWSKKSLFRYGNIGSLDEARLHPKFKRYNVDWIKKNYPSIKKRGITERREKAQKQKRNYFEWLGNDLQEIVTDYLQHRKEYPVLFRSIKYEKFSTQDAWKTHREELSRLLYFIICERSGIKNYWIKESDKFHYRELSQDEMKSFDSELFSLDNFTLSDLKAMLKGKTSDYAKYQVRKYFKPFLWFYLMRQSEEIYQRETVEQVSLDKEIAQMVRKADLLEEWFTTYTPLPRRKNKALMKKNSSSKIKSIFLDRGSIVRLYNRILWDPHIHDPLKYATMLTMSFLTTIRPNELRQMEIDKHLVIDKHTGLLKTFTINGVDFGKVIITERISKKTSGPSGMYDLLLVPSLVSLLNVYLKSLYKKHPHTVGKGFLFRPMDLEDDPNRSYSNSGTMFQWIGRHKAKFKDILSEDEISHFSSYDTRHTGNNLIVKKTFFTNPYLNSLKTDVAIYHARHWGDTGINRDHYQAPFSEEEYAAVIYGALGFPFDEEKLKEWEKNILPPKQNITGEKGQSSRLSESKKQSEEEMERHNKTIKEKMRQLEKEKSLLEDQSSARKRGLDIRTRLARISEINRKITDLEKQLLTGVG